ncbi:MAG: DMT family transporter [Candidatus Nomurabacteria bacterium]|nr:DMT family transporter [Candidatus Nomurabacteria bacterium]
MNWFFIALIGPFLYALTNHIDKILLEKYFKKSGVGTLILFSSLLSAIALPFFFIADSTILNVDVKSIIILSIVGILNVLVLWCYLIALQYEEASITVIFYQLVPVFGYILGYFILGEVLNKLQLIAMATIILGMTIVSFEVDSDNRFKLRKRTVFPMLLAAFFWALGSVLFKLVAIEENLWRSLFWEHLMLVFVGIFIFTFIRSYRTNFLTAIKVNSKAIISLNILNELLYILGNIVFAFAYLLAPIGLVLITESFQPIFVLIIGIFLTIFFPKITVEKIKAKHLWPKIIAILITGIGTYVLFIS